MKKIFSFLIIILTANLMFAQQTYIPNLGEITIKVQKSDTLYGYKYKGKQVLKNKFEEIGPCGGGIAIVKLKGKWGFIDRTGKIIVKPVYQKAKMKPRYGLVFDEKENGWKIVNSSGLTYSNDTYSDIQELPLGYVLARRKGEQKMELILSDFPNIKHIDSAQVFSDEQFLLFFSGHKNGKQISENTQTDSVQLFKFHPDFKHSNYRNQEYPYFMYVDSIFKSKDSILILKSYFSPVVYYYNPKMRFENSEKGKIQHLGGNSYSVEVNDTVSQKWEPRRGLILDKGWYFEPVLPLLKYRRIKKTNHFLVVFERNKSGYTVFDFEGNHIATAVKNVEAINNYLTLIETSSNNYSLYKENQLLAKSSVKPISCNNGFFIVFTDSSALRKYVFINREGNITGDIFDAFYEEKKMYLLSIFPITSFEPTIFNTFTEDSIVGLQVVVTKYLTDKKQLFFGTMYENGEINIPLKYYSLKPLKYWGFIFSIHTKNGIRFGLLDWKGTEIIAPVFSEMSYHHKTEGDLLKVTRNKRTFYIDKTGKEIRNK